jgi:hypothetical protein
MGSKFHNFTYLEGIHIFLFFIHNFVAVIFFEFIVKGFQIVFTGVIAIKFNLKTITDRRKSAGILSEIL